LLEDLGEHNLLQRFQTIQLSRHGKNYFNIEIPDMVERYCRIQERLQRTHEVEWMYEWMWERWVKKSRLTAAQKSVLYENAV